MHRAGSRCRSSSLSSHRSLTARWTRRGPILKLPRRKIGAIRRQRRSEGVLMKKIMVCIKRVVDYNVRVRVKPDGSGVMLDGIKMSVNPFDEIALEEALRIKERGSNIEVVAVSIGTADTQQQLRTALAMGADRAILVQTDLPVEPLTAAQTFLAVAKKENPDLILLGKQAIDDDAHQTGQMLAAIWERPQATYASKV